LPARKANASLTAIENSVLEGLKSQHPELADADGDFSSLIQLEHELADPTHAVPPKLDL
jgi:hypothetical protein